MKKITAGAIAILVIASGLYLIFGTGAAPVSSAPLKLPDGSTVRVLAATYGTNHIIGTTLARLTAHAPNWAQTMLKRVFGKRAVPLQSFQTSEPELVVWLDRTTNGSPPAILGTWVEAYLGDGSNFISGDQGTIMMMWGSMTGQQINEIPFKVFPRRDPQIKINFFNRSPAGTATNSGAIVFANPKYRRYPEWKAESLPIVKKAGDVEVTVSGLHTGYGANSTMTYLPGGKSIFERSTDRSDGRNLTVVDMSIRPLTNTNEVWVVAGEDVSDAAGNAAHNTTTSGSGSGIEAFAFSPGLWPSEGAWKLRLEIKRTQGFRPDEIVVFKNVPLGNVNQTNVIAWRTNAGDLNVTLQQIYRRLPSTNNSWSSGDTTAVKFTFSNLHEGTQFDLISAVVAPGKTNSNSGSESSDGYKTYFFRDIPAEAETADFTVAVQQSKFVEFTVKPEGPKPPGNPK